jgi:hypothetical protein
MEDFEYGFGKGLLEKTYFPKEDNFFGKLINERAVEFWSFGCLDRVEVKGLGDGFYITAVPKKNSPKYHTTRRIYYVIQLFDKNDILKKRKIAKRKDVYLSMEAFQKYIFSRSL